MEKIPKITSLPTPTSNRRKMLIKICLFFAFLAMTIISLYVGRYLIEPLEICKILISKIIPISPTWTLVDETVVMRIRLPRTLAAILVGMALSSSGTAFQSTFRNPLVSEQILGAAASAGFGAALGLLLGLSLSYVEVLSFCFGLFAVFLVFLISKSYRKSHTLIIVLAGVIIGSLFSSLTSLVKYVADPQDKLPSIVFWLMGSFSRVMIEDIYYVAPIIIGGFIGLLLVRWRLNVLSLGEEEIKALGVNVSRLRFLIILFATLMTASAVCISGVIGWVGLIIPHISRMLVGPDHRSLVPASAITGSTYLLIVDLLCRTLTTAEIPIGIITSIIGLPIFLFLVKKTKESWL